MWFIRINLNIIFKWLFKQLLSLISRRPAKYPSAIERQSIASIRAENENYALMPNPPHQTKPLTRPRASIKPKPLTPAVDDWAAW